MSNEGLNAMIAKIAATLANKPEVLIKHPAELRVLRTMTDKQMRDLAAEHGWRIVRRLGGRQIEFYNDASTRGFIAGVL